MTVGKCIHCKIRFVWNEDIRLCDSGCPYCHNPLEYTTISNVVSNDCELMEQTPFQYATTWEDRSLVEQVIQRHKDND